MATPLDPQAAILKEFGMYYNADELGNFYPDRLGGRADRSAARLSRILGDRASEAAELLRELAANPEHPLFVQIEIQTMYGWNDGAESRAVFQELACRIADGITSN